MLRCSDDKIPFSRPSTTTARFFFTFIHLEITGGSWLISKIMSSTILEPWAIIFVILLTVFVMYSLVFLPSVIVILWRRKQMTDISLHGTI